jgi:hypothetical protein
LSELDEIRDRVTRLEGQMAEIRADAAAARVLAGAADRDVAEFRGELRAHRSLLNALRETQLEQGQLLADHGVRLDRLERKVDEGFTKVGLGMAQITALLTDHLGRPGQS